MIPISDIDLFHQVAGFRPLHQSGDPKRLVGGPFRLSVTVANAAAMAFDLSLRGSWVNDRRVAKSYAITSSGDATRLDATLTLEAVRINFRADLSLVSGANKAKLFAAATEPYLSGLIGGTEWRQTLSFNESMPIRNLASTAAGPVGYVTILAEPLPLHAPMRCYLGSDSLSLVSDAAVALGADEAADLEIWGTLAPGNEGTVHPGAASCGPPGRARRAISVEQELEASKIRASQLASLGRFRIR